jgi:hypothetical protein
MITGKRANPDSAATSSEEDSSAMASWDLSFKQSPVIIYVVSVEW